MDGLADPLAGRLAVCISIKIDELLHILPPTGIWISKNPSKHDPISIL